MIKSILIITHEVGWKSWFKTSFGNQFSRPSCGKGYQELVVSITYYYLKNYGIKLDLKAIMKLEPWYSMGEFGIREKK